MTPLYLLRFSGLPILEQLRIEEALLRVDTRNWCILNEGTSPAIVMGISGNPDLLLNYSALKQEPIPVVRRFSGGGTVVVDENTLFATFICNQKETAVPCYPEHVLRWTEQFYRSVFSNPHFQLIENDYVLGNRKFGGNAQYFRKDRWLHHTSLLWDYHPERMNTLLMPPKTPKYRIQRPHNDFLCRLRDHYPSKTLLQQQILSTLRQQFTVVEVTLEEIKETLEIPHRRATEIIKS